MDKGGIVINTNENKNDPSYQVNLLNDYGNNRAPKEKRAPYKKIFVERNSLLTDLYENNKHICALYNLFVAITIYLILINLLYEWRDNGVISFGFADMAPKFYKFEFAILVWMVNMSLTLLIFPVFKMWENKYRQTKFKKLIGTFFISIYCGYAIGIHAISVFVCLKDDMSVISNLALLIETVRLGMKSYAYVRSNVERVITQKELNSPTFGHYMYFLWCPTLLYRDSYPRTKNRSWKRVFKYLLEFLTAIYCGFVMNKYFLQKSFVDYGKTEVTLLSMIIRWVEITIVVTPLFYFYAFCVLQHTWMNMFAELLQFGDRVFYKDWWNSKSMKEYYRRWSVLVHEWLYEYLFTDLYNHVTRQSFTISSLATFVISAIYHEYVLAISMRFFVPALLVLYLTLGILYLYIDLGSRAGNIFVWFNLTIGMTLLFLLYLMEFYARINCPDDHYMRNSTFSYYFTPMILKCNNILIQ